MGSKLSWPPLELLLFFTMAVHSGLTLLLLACGVTYVLGATLNSRGAAHEERVVGGQDVDDYGKYPWQCSFRLWGSHRCGCSLIHPQYAVTAAHCFLQPTEMLTVVMGATNLHSEDNIELEVDSIIPHADFKLDAMLGLPNDIMLVKLKEPVDLDAVPMTLISVPTLDHDFSGAECSVSGWGAVAFGRWMSPNENLKAAEQKLIAKKDCILALDEDPSKPSITDKQICSIYPTQAACAGDSGGPPACQLGGHWYQPGVISWGEDCNTALPTVYTRLAHYRDWLAEHGALVEDKAEVKAEEPEARIDHSLLELVELLKKEQSLM